MLVKQFTGRSRIAIVFFALLFLFNGVYGLQFRMPGAQVPLFFGAASVVFFALLARFGFVTLSGAPQPAAQGAGHGVVAGVVLFFAITMYLTLRLPVVQLGALIGIMAAGAALTSRLAGPRAALTLLLLAGAVAVIVIGLQTPLDIDAANMLPIIQAACVDLQNGISPYGKTYPLIASLPMYYLPGALLPYCGLEWSGIDLRWLNVAAYLVLCAAALRSARRPDAGGEGFLILAPLLVSSSMLLFMAHVHEWLYWIVCLAAVLSVLKDRIVLAGLFVGLMLATRQHALFLALPLAAVCLARVGSMRTLLAGGLALLVVLLVGVLPTGLTPLEYLRTFYLDVATAGASANNSGGNPFDQIALSGMVLKAAGRSALSALQVLAVLGGSLACWRLGGDPRRAMVALGLTYVVAIASNPFLSRYLYMPGFFLLAFGAMVPLSAPRKRP